MEVLVCNCPTLASTGNGLEYCGINPLNCVGSREVAYGWIWRTLASFILLFLTQ